MNAAIRNLMKKLPEVARLLFRRPNSNKDENLFFLPFADASFHADVSKNRLGMLVTRAFGLRHESPIHTIGFFLISCAVWRAPQRPPKHLRLRKLMTDLTIAVLRQKGWSLNDRPELFSYSTIPANTAMSVRRGAPMKKF
jgi:hypothetical protein